MEWLQEHEWMPNEPNLDLGEDFLVNVYENGRSTGLTLFVQHKSTDNIEKFKLKGHAAFSYPIHVADLIHWRKSATPVYLIVCDAKIKSQRYYLGLYESFFSELGADNQTWRDQETVNVRIPTKNLFDELAFSKIKRELANHFEPIYLKKHNGIGFKLSLSFPSTPEGRKNLDAFNRFIDAGHPVTLGRECIKEFRFSEWYERLYGPAETDSLTLSPSTTKKSIRIRFEAVPDDGSPPASQIINFKVIRGGRRETVLSNEASEAPIVFTMKAVRDGEHMHVTTNFKMRHNGNTLFDTRDALHFLLTVKRGGVAYLREESSGEMLGSHTLIAVPTAQHNLAAELKLVDQLFFIQNKLRLSKPFSLKNRRLTLQDYRKCAELYEILRNGHKSITATLSFSVSIDDKIMSSIQEQPKPYPCLEIRQKSKVSCKLFGVSIDLGACEHEAKLTAEQTVSFVEQLQRAVRLKQERAGVRLKDVIVHTVYSQWIPNSGVSTPLGALVSRDVEVST